MLLELDPQVPERGRLAERRSRSRRRRGALVPLESVVSFKETVGPQSINHSGQLPSVSVSFGLRPGRVARRGDRAREAGGRPRAAGDGHDELRGVGARCSRSRCSNLGLLLFVAIGVVYIVLGALYESYIHPITILSGLPSAGLGALVTLWLFGNELNIYSFVGLIMLIGIVKKNAIMQIDFALEAERKHGKTPAEAIYEGCIIRFRPIMMTTMAALLGALPIALGYGAGGEARRPLGLAVVGGLVVSQLHHALSDAGRLHLSWRRCSRPAQTARLPRRLACRAPVTACRSHEHLRRIHPASDRDQPADGGDRAVRRWSRIGRCRSAICRTSTSRRCSSRRSCRAPARRRWASSVATPLENQFSMIAGLESMTSVNSLGSTQITLEFDLNRSLDGAAVDVQAAITQAARLLPQGMPTPPTFTKVNPADQPILYLVITSTTLPPWTLDEYAETRIAQRISMVSGVAQVQVLGSQKYAVHAQLDPHALAARQIGINEVETALRNWNVNSPTGTIVGPHKAFTLQATGQLMNADSSRRWSSPTATARRSGSTSSARHRRRRGSADRRRGSTRTTPSSARSRSASSGSPAPTRSPSPTR